MKYAVYKTDTGEILRVVQCPASQAAGQAGAGEAVLPCADDTRDDRHRVELGPPPSIVAIS